MAYLYPVSLAVVSGLVFALEHFRAWRPAQRQLRPRFGSDLVHLVFNGHFLGVMLAGLADTWLLPPVDGWLARVGLTDTVYRNAAASWPLWLQLVVALVSVDFVQWCVHNLLHRVPWLWELHKAHHSVRDGEMDWIVAFRFSWLEVVVYKSVLYFPLAFFGFRWEALMFHAVFGTLIGHLNHANLDWGHGPWRYVLNSPRMHIWHHDYEGDAKTTVNFGIIFSAWDWIFGTAKMPPEPTPRLGFHGVETFPDDFSGHALWPLHKLWPRLARRSVSVASCTLVLGAAWMLREPPTTGAPRSAATPMLGETMAASQPSAPPAQADAYASSPAAAQAALVRLGEQARSDGYGDPDAIVSVRELAGTLGALSLVLLDVRPHERFLLGHIPGARQLYRSDYSSSEVVPGLSRSRPELQRMLRGRGVRQDSTVVLYGDGGPEPYRLWWTLRALAGYPTRVLDGGLQAWKAAGHRVAGGQGALASAGNVTLKTPKDAPKLRWSQVAAFAAEHAGLQWLDTRSRIEYGGQKQHRKAARAGHIPGAKHLDWFEVMREPPRDQRMKSPAALRALFARHEVLPGTPVVTYCQSGTRSAAVYFALHQLGFSRTQILNYDGSWAEYSRGDEPVER